MNMQLRKEIAKFHTRHGPDFVHDADSNRILYANGAWRELSPYGVQAPPPSADTEEGEFELAQNIVRFYAAKHEKAVAAFNEHKRFLANFDPNDDRADGELVKLRRLQNAVKEARTLLRKAEQNLAKTERGKRLAIRDQGDDEERDRKSTFRNRLSAVRI